MDHLYTFFVQWSPEIYGKDAKEQGFVVVEKEELDMIDNFFSEPTTKSWEVSAFCFNLKDVCAHPLLHISAFALQMFMFLSNACCFVQACDLSQKCTCFPSALLCLLPVKSRRTTEQPAEAVPAFWLSGLSHLQISTGVC